MWATTLVDTLRAQGWAFAIDGAGIRVRSPRGALTDELRQAIRAEKAAIVTILAAEQQRAQIPLQGDDLVAVKVWSERLEEALWVVAEGISIDECLAHGGGFTPYEVRVLVAQGRGVKAWAPLDPGTQTTQAHGS
jgi:TubC N-terminal docking domain